MSSGLRRGDGTKIRRKACESGWYTCDSIWKVPTVGHLGPKGHKNRVPEMPDNWKFVNLLPEIPDGWNFPYSITCVPAAFARFPSYLPTITSPYFCCRSGCSAMGQSLWHFQVPSWFFSRYE